MEFPGLRQAALPYQTASMEYSDLDSGFDRHRKGAFESAATEAQTRQFPDIEIVSSRDVIDRSHNITYF